MTEIILCVHANLVLINLIQANCNKLLFVSVIDVNLAMQSTNSVLILELQVICVGRKNSFIKTAVLCSLQLRFIAFLCTNRCA